MIETHDGPHTGAEGAPLVYLVILNWNGWRDTLACLDSLAVLLYPNYRVVVVDNASEDGSEARIRQAHPDLTLIQSGANLGFAGGSNVGLRRALADGADYVWLLNNDTLVEPDALTQLVTRIQADPEVGMCGSTLLYEGDRETVQALGGASYNPWLGTVRHLGAGWPKARALGSSFDLTAIERQLDYLIGASLLVSRPFLEKVGLLCEDYFLYFEELDWALRAKGHFKLAYAPRSVVYHKEGSSIGGNTQVQDQKSWTADFYALKNRVAFSRKFYPYALPTVYLGLVAAMLNRVRRRQWNRVGLIAKIMLTRGKVGFP